MEEKYTAINILRQVINELLALNARCISMDYHIGAILESICILESLENQLIDEVNNIKK